MKRWIALSAFLSIFIISIIVLINSSKHRYQQQAVLRTLEINLYSEGDKFIHTDR